MVSPDDVNTCMTFLILKSKDRSPACVKPDTSKMLLERGWVKSM